LAEVRVSRGAGVAVIGLGRFGSSVAASLVRMGQDVLALDEDAGLVQRWASELTHTVEADGTDLETLKSLGVGDFPHAVVAIGTDVEASVLSVLALTELGIPDIWAKAVNPNHGRILERTGAHHVVYPEAEMGERVAHLVTGRMIDFIEFEDGFGIAKTKAPLQYVGRTVSDPAMRTRHGVSIVGIKRAKQEFSHAAAETRIEHGDVLIVSGPTALVEKFAALP
jgi:trk system potassium uptake protein